MSCPASPRSLLIGSLSALLLMVIPACRQEAVELLPSAEYAYQDLKLGESVTLDLPSSKSGANMIRVEGLETAFESSVVGDGGETLSIATLPYIRTGPIFYVIEGQAGAMPPHLVIRPSAVTQDAQITATVYELPNESRRDRARIEAYRAYEAATQATDDESPELWRKRAELLRSAASGFRRVGDTEQQLWAEYLEAYVHYFPLAEYDTAAETAADIQVQARELGFDEIELMATELEGQALIERDEGDTQKIAQEKAERGQSVLERAVDLADGMGYGYEQAYALNSRGIGYFYQGRHDEAEQWYEQALAMALDLQDPSLLNMVRGNLALVKERQGDLNGALAVLQAVNAQLREAGTKVDLAYSWSELGRLYHRLYLFPEAIEAEHQALELWGELNSAEGKGRSALSLAYAYHAMGNAHTALSLVHDAIEDMQSAGYARGLRSAYALLASLNRLLGQHEAMFDARARQSNYLTSEVHRARHQYELGLDSLAAYPDDSSRADGYFAEAERLGNAVGDAGLSLRARLRRCVDTLELPDETCEPRILQAEAGRWLPGAAVNQAFEARYLAARNLLNFKANEEAKASLDDLVDDIQLYRANLPGVLGAWFWESRAAIFETYMSLFLPQDGAGGAQTLESLAAFNRLLNTSLGRAAAGRGEASPAQAMVSTDLRDLLAQLEHAGPADTETVQQAIDRELLALRPAAADSTSSLDLHDLESLVSGMPADSALLSYYLSDGPSWVWVATRDGVRHYPLGEGPAVRDALSKARSGMRVIGYGGLDDDLKEVGEALLGPIGQPLPGAIYLLAAGDLAGFPFEAIRRNDRYFGQDHDVVNVLTLQALDDVAGLRQGSSGWQHILIAGNPAGEGGGIAELPASARELGSLAALFQDKTLTHREGTDLGLQLLSDPAFASADLIHLATHAEVNLAYPELSRLMLSAGAGSQDYLTPLDLSHMVLTADLVVLSACETTGVNSFSFDSNLGFIPTFLRSGAGAVVASLWPVGDAFAAEFMQAFYAAMKEGASAPDALAQVKHTHIAGHEAGSNLDWVSFQIYVN